MTGQFDTSYEFGTGPSAESFAKTFYTVTFGHQIYFSFFPAEVPTTYYQFECTFVGQSVPLNGPTVTITAASVTGDSVMVQLYPDTVFFYLPVPFSGVHTINPTATMLISGKTLTDLNLPTSGTTTYTYGISANTILLTYLGAGVAVSGGDPHLTPFYHPLVPFTLPAARKTLDVYNYITLPDFQQNCRFIKYPDAWNGEYVIEVGMLIRDPKSKAVASTITVGPVKSSNNRTWSLRVRVDNADVTQTTTHTQLFTTEQRSASEVIVEFAMLRVDITLKFAHGLPYLNLKEEALLPEVLQTAHGLIGQSARPEVPYKTPRKECFECFVKGTMEDYLVQSGDLFGTDFQYNLFEEKK